MSGFNPINELKTYIKELFDALTTRLDALITRVDALTTEVKEMNQRLNRVERKLWLVAEEQIEQRQLLNTLVAEVSRFNGNQYNSVGTKIEDEGEWQ